MFAYCPNYTLLTVIIKWLTVVTLLRKDTSRQIIDVNSSHLSKFCVVYYKIYNQFYSKIMSIIHKYNVMLAKCL